MRAGLFHQLTEHDLDFSFEEFTEFLIADIEDMLASKSITFSIFDYGADIPYGLMSIAAESLSRAILRALKLYEPRLCEPEVDVYVADGSHRAKATISGHVFYKNHAEYISFCIYY